MKIFVFSIYVCCLAFFACKNNIVDTKKFADPEQAYIDISEDIKLQHRERGYTDAILTAPLMHRYYKEEEKLIFPKGFELELYDEGKMTAIISAKYGEKNEIYKQVTASKDVKIVTYKKEILESDTLLWDESKSKVIIDGKVKVTTPTDIISGKGLVSDDRFKNYKMSKITGILSVEDNNVPN
ncbi:MAG: LPS export ABC transporter periplasmic protein LptC [Chitinophagales bacterium]|nr:LPS export ABC transporter periplasmic protein LptC [Chitinophagales bacterium]